MNRHSRLHKRDRAMLVFYVTRQLTSLAILGWITSSAFQMQDKRLAWVAVTAMFAFAGWVTWVLTQSVRRYRQRYPREIKPR